MSCVGNVTRTKKIPLDVRSRIVDMSENMDYSVKTILEKLQKEDIKISIQSIKRFLRMYEQTGSVEAKKRGGICLDSHEILQVFYL